MKNKALLTKKEIDTLVLLLPKLRWPLPYPVFIALCKSVPVIPINLAIMPDSNHILLTYRKDQFYDNWHIPGMILRYGEKIRNRLRLVAKDELGMRIKNIRFVGYSEYRDAREHGIGLLFMAQAIGSPSDGRYFPLDGLPEGFLSEQMKDINLLRNFSKNGR
ncbi:MAG: hypothetical protein KGI60_03535 [Patescibacteria group bacterium]|nr:hypothetical protein [Patescibacteria group bacterium]